MAEKLISVAVPCFNSAKYMRGCIESLLTGGEEMEIIIVNDGSSDDTLSIAREYEEKFPAIVRVIDKANGGHGSGVNAGLRAAAGLYYKVVDSDDWVDASALQTLLAAIRRHRAEGTPPDLYVTNFVYDRVSDATRHVSSYRKKLPVGTFFGWERVKKFRFSHMMLMHALLYRREVLLRSGMVLPEHTFYVDNIYAYVPLPFVKTLFYLDVDLYHYFIGRDDQSVNRRNFVKRYEQQLRVMRRMTDAYRWDALEKLPKGLKNYMYHSLNALMATTITFTCGDDAPERRENLQALWDHIKRTDKRLYRRLRYRSYAALVNFMPWKLRGAVTMLGYRILCRKVKLGAYTPAEKKKKDESGEDKASRETSIEKIKQYA